MASCPRAVLLIKMNPERSLPKNELRRAGELPIPPINFSATVEMIKAMGEGQWRIPSIEDIKSGDCLSLQPWTNLEEVAREAANFCKLAKIGITRFIRPTTPEITKEFTNQLLELGVWDFTRKALEAVDPKKVEKMKELLNCAERSFNHLLEEGEMEPGDPEKAKELFDALGNYAVSVTGKKYERKETPFTC